MPAPLAVTDPKPVGPALVAWVPGWLLGLVAALVIASPLRFDDLINVELRQSLADQGVSLPEFIGDQTSAWATTQGRFFPVSVAWTSALFYVADDRVPYKVVVAALVVLAALSTAAVTRAIAGSAVVPVAVVAVVATLQVRTWTDGLTSFAGLLPGTAALTLGALALVLRKGGVVRLALAGVMFTTALLAYETVVLFVPAIAAVVLLMRRRWTAIVPFVAPDLAQIVIVLVLRAGLVQAPATAYSFGGEPTAVATTFARQFLAALPLSQWWLGAPDVPPLSLLNVVLCLAIVGVPAWWVLRRPVVIENPRRAAALLVLLGAWIWVSSSGLIALTVRWQESMTWGQGYLSVTYAYLGVALCGLAIWIIVAPRLGRLPRGVGETLAAIVAVVVALTVAGGLTIIP